jgi:Tfp pilus assembly protein FimT
MGLIGATPGWHGQSDMRTARTRTSASSLTSSVSFSRLTATRRHRDIQGRDRAPTMRETEQDPEHKTRTALWQEGIRVRKLPENDATPREKLHKVSI